MNTIQRIKYLVVGLLSLLIPALSSAQSPSENYILSRTFTSKDGSTSLERVTYFDGLGRPSQTVSVGITPTGKDLVTLQEYDSRSRESVSWLPVRNAGSGALMSVSSLKSAAAQQYGDSRPYSQTAYEASPLDRPVSEYGAGEAWASKAVTIRHAVLDAHDVAPAGMQRPNGLYPATVATDEDGRTTYTLTDGFGHTVLSGLKDGDEAQLAFHVYDNRDDLTYVHTPFSYYFFLYDPLHHRIYEQSQGVSVYHVYDRGGRAVFSQDGERRERGEWSFALPDAFGRTVLTGICTNTYDADECPLLGTVVKATRTDATNALYGHTVSGVTLETPVVHSVSFYDDYSFIGRNGIPSSLNYAAPPSGYGTCYTGGYKGLQTGAVTARLDEDGVSGYDYTAFYYDDRGRVIQTRSTNHLGGTDVEYVAYDFTGNPVKRRRVHTANGKPTQTETYTYTYDHAGRLTTVKHKLNSRAEVTLVSNTYDELGRLQSQAPHGSATNRQTYSYNIRGWLTGISGGKFTQSLHYHTGSGTPQYGGNVSSMTWKAGNEATTRGYKFAYDGLNRLTTATYGEGANISNNANRFTEKVTAYDLNGNIKGLQRYGQTGASTYGLLDNLTYTLDGNQVTRVDDASTATAYNNGFAFKDAVKQANEYTYDKNGNLTQDLNKNILSIEYNALNLPCEVTFGNGNAVTYLYSADGTKLRTVHKTGNTTVTTDYVGNVVYENNSPKLLLTDAGYVSLADGKYHYYLKDHQGNNRVVIASNGTVEEVNHYYPFGGVFASSGSVQPYKYNGKELDRENGLDWYDYGARHYDAALGRFLTVDPLAQKYWQWSPYAYCADNPVNRIDPTGMEWVNPKDASRLKELIGKRIASLKKSIDKYQKRIDGGRLGKWRLARNQRKLSEAEGRVKNLKQSQEDIKLLGDDPNNKYAFNQVDGGMHRVWKGDDGVVYIDTSSDALSIHEITHIRQSLENGGLEFSEEDGYLLNVGNKYAQTDIKRYEVSSRMEVEAYQKQYSYDKSFPGSTHGKGLQGIDVHSVGEIGNGNIYEYIKAYSKYLRENKILLGK